jgi:hypothetical protein
MIVFYSNVFGLDSLILDYEMGGLVVIVDEYWTGYWTVDFME